jgi:hypothetical protein
LDEGLAEILHEPVLLLSGRLRSFLAGVPTDLFLVVMKILPFALHWRLQHNAIRSASYTEDRKGKNHDYGQNPHTGPM